MPRPGRIRVLPLLRLDPKFTLRARSWVSRLIYDKAAKKVTGVVYTDTRTGEEYEQPAGLVVLSAYVFGNVSLLFHSGIGEPYDPATSKGAVGKNYCYQLSRMGVTMYFENKEFNPFMGAPGSVMALDDVDGDNFDHAGLGFLGGSRRPAATAMAGRSATGRCRPARRAGARLEEGDRQWYRRAVNIAVSGSNYANRNNYLDLDPTYKDQLGRPLLRMTYNFVENDFKVAEYTVGVAAKIARDPTIVGPARVRRGDYDIVPYQSTHNTGGTIMGTGSRRRAWSIATCRPGTPATSSSWAPPPSAAAGLQPDRAGRRARLLGGRRSSRNISRARVRWCSVIG